MLKSVINGNIYIGFTDDLRNRVKIHNNGRVNSTKAFKPWILVYYEAYYDKRDASRREKLLNNHRAKEDLQKQLVYSLK